MKTKRNDLCSCGSGKKYKKCCLDRSEKRSVAQLSRPQSEIITSRFSATGAEPTPEVVSQILALFNAGQFLEMESKARLLAKQYSNSGFAWKAFGICLQMQGKDGLVALQRAAELLPHDAEIFGNLGNMWQERGQLNNALSSYSKALRINPNFAEAHHNLGNVLRELGQLVEAVASCRRALEIKPDFAEAHHNLGNVFQELGQFDDALASSRRALQIRPDFTEAHSSVLFIHNCLSRLPPATLLTESRRVGELAARKASPHKEWSNVPDVGRCLRVGLVSGDLLNHPVGYFVEGMLAELATCAAGRLEFIGYHGNACSDELTERIKVCCHRWHSAVGLSDEILARRINQDGIDILIDLSGHTARNRLSMFAWKPAPVQVSWLGYFATTGVAAMDYLIADPWTAPESDEAHFTETIQRLPETYLCFTPPAISLEVSSLPALSEGYLTFGCFNKLYKMNDEVVGLWARVLHAVPGSRLFLKTSQLNETVARHKVIQRFASHNIAAERLILERSAPRAQLLAAYARVDIAFDPFPYPGGTTTIEALWMGVPVLTLAGDRFLSHIGESIMQNAGLPEWIAIDTDDYVLRAVAHAGNLQRLATLRKGLRQQVLCSPLFDARRFALNFQSALRDMWAEWCNKLKQGPGRSTHTAIL